MKTQEEFEFEKVFRQYVKELYIFAIKILGDEEAAEDAVQNFFIKLWSNREAIRLDSSFRSYCYTAVYHESLNILRHRKHFEKISESIVAPIDIQNEMDRMDMRFKLKNAIYSLPEKCRQIFVSVCVDGYSYEDVATMYNLSINTVKVQVSKAFKFLRKKLSDDEQSVLLFLFTEKILFESVRNQDCVL